MELRHTAQREGLLLSFLRRELGMSVTLVNRLKWIGAYRVDGQVVRTNFPVKRGMEITVCLDEPTPEYPAEEGPLQILYEDEAMIALDKPAGILVHPSSARNTGTLANHLIHYYAQTGQRSAVHPVSRLDRDTFGVILLAKNAHVHALLCNAMKAGKIQKTYLAAVYGQPPAQTGLVDAPIARVPGHSLLRCVQPDGQNARSRYEVLHTTDACALLRLQPLTGRTHQLRVHCAHLGTPILGDPQYGSPESTAFSLRYGLTTQQLCAAELTLTHPLGGQAMVLSSRQQVLLPSFDEKNSEFAEP